MAEGTLSIVVKEMGGKTVTLDVSPSETVASLKARVAESHQIPVGEQKLAWRGKNLEDEAMLSTYRLRKRATLLLMRTPAAAAAHNSASLNGSDADLGVPPKPCLKNCGFYGLEETEGYCSQCHQELKKEKEEEDAKRAAELKAKEEAERAEREAKRPKQEDVTRCYKCNKRVGITIIQCRCGYSFCAKHRYSVAHDCTYDYKHSGRDQLRKANQQIKADKLVDRLD